MLKKISAFAFVWLMVGFSTGTSTLLGPVGWITSVGRSGGWSQRLEDAVVAVVIVLYVLVSALIAAGLTRVVVATPHRHVRLGVPALTVLAAGGALGLWLNPQIMGSDSGDEQQVGSSFTIGPYPTEQRMRDLKSEGYTGIISLLHPTVVPFESKLIADGRAAAERAGIRFIHVPMLPWIGDNSEALARIEELARSGEGRYYVHCYLGKDRVRLAMRLIEEVEPDASISTSDFLDAHVAYRTLAQGTELERGKAVEVADRVFLLPFPTDSEMVSYIVPGTHGRVVSLLDPDNPDDRIWIEKERALLESYRIPLVERPLPIAPYDPARALEIAREVAELTRPMVIHAFLAFDSGRSPAAEAFLQAFRSNLPPLPPSLFVEPMGQVQVSVLAPNVAAGPRPLGPDFGAYLFPRGIRELIFLGDAASKAAREDHAIAEMVGMGWRAVAADDPNLSETLSTGGPWYVYGSEPDAVQPLLRAGLGPAIPTEMRWEPVVAERQVTDEPEPAAVAEPSSFLGRAVPDVKTAVLLGPILLLFTALAAWLVGWLRSTREMNAPYTRKIFHFIIFSMASVLHLAAGLSAVVLFGVLVSSAVLYAVWRGAGFPFYEAMARPTDAPRQRLFILVPLATTAVGGLAANLLFGAFAHVGYLVAGWGDAIGEPVGTAWGRHRYRVPSIAGVAASRSVEGSAAVFFVGALVAFAGLSLAGFAAPTAFAAALACGVAGSLVEAVSNHGLDKLTIQIVASGVAYLFLS